MLRRCLLTALVVGTILTLLNTLLPIYLKIPMNYVVPFLVSSWGVVMAGGGGGGGRGPRYR